MSELRKRAGYTIGATSLAGAVAIAVDRYAEFSTGAEGVLSWGLPPLALAIVAVTALASAKLGYPSERSSDA